MYCDHCKAMIEPNGFDYVIVVGRAYENGEIRPKAVKLSYHVCCAKLDILPKITADDCCEDHWLGSR